jgi:hypothetical protein
LFQRFKNRTALTNFQKDLKRFRPTDIIDSKNGNKFRKETIKVQKLFVANKTDDTGFDGIVYPQRTSLIANLSTRTNIYDILLNHSVISSKTKKTKLYTIKVTYFRPIFIIIKAFLDGTLSYGNTRYYLLFIAYLQARGLTKSRFIKLKTFQLKRMLKKTSGLSDDDVNKLRSISPQHPLIDKFAQFSMILVQQWASIFRIAC